MIRDSKTNRSRIKVIPDRRLNVTFTNMNCGNYNLRKELGSQYTTVLKEIEFPWIVCIVNQGASEGYEDIHLF